MTITSKMILCALVAGLGMEARAATLFSTSATGRARQFEITCSTCPNTITELSDQTDGGFGDTSAFVEFANGTLVSYLANAIFTGPHSLPHLSSESSGNIAVVAPSTFFYQASSVARATQRYRYTGTAPTEYTLEYDINGSMVGGILTEIDGGFTVFGAGFDPNKEVQPVLGFSFDHENGDGTERQVHLTGNVTFSVNPGDIVFVQATLDTFADSRSQQLFASADASHTLSMDFTEGDPSLLVAASGTPTGAVPEPSFQFPIGLGLAAVILAAKRLLPRRVYLPRDISRSDCAR